jgi:hypothetical protein
MHLWGPRGKLLGYIITKHDIEGYPDKILAIAKIGHVRSVKGIQWLMGCLGALSNFVSRPRERGLPLYKLLKKSDSVCWTDEMQRALDNPMVLISKTLYLGSLEPGESLLLHIVATTQVISVTLVEEREEPRHVYKIQGLVYYISKVLSNCETRYNQV